MNEESDPREDVFLCSCGEALHLYRTHDVEGAFVSSWQHGDNPEHSLMGGVFWEVTGDKSRELCSFPVPRRGEGDEEVQVLDFFGFAKQRVVVRGRWIDTIHARMPS